MDEAQGKGDDKVHKPQAYCKPISEDVEYFGAGDVISEELLVIRERRTQRKLPDNPNLKTSDLCGLALSGGGIRSASYSLGVMQALAFNGWLSGIDYLSTVSGGGYIGSSLTWALNSSPETFGMTDQTFPFASFPMSGEPRHEQLRTPVQTVLQSRTEDSKWSGRLLNFLRQNAKYLTPGNGLNLFSVVWVALRAAGMGFMVYGALITFVFLIAFQCGLLQEACIFTYLPKTLRQNWFLLTAVLGFGLCVVSVPVYSLVTYFYHWAARGTAYPFRRKYERLAGWLLPLLLTLLLLGIVPHAHNFVISKGSPEVRIENKTIDAGQFQVSGKLKEEGKLTFNGTMTLASAAEQNAESLDKPCEKPCPEPQPFAKSTLWSNLYREVNALFIGLGTLLVGLVSGVMAFVKTKSAKSGIVPLKLLVGLGVAALLFGIVLFAYTVASAVVQTTGCSLSNWWHISVGLLVTLALAVFTNINHISIHRYYRDRLMETFMPDIKKVLQGEYQNAAKSGEANTRILHDMVNGPYHIINTNAVLVNSHNPKLRGRGGDNFILSPQYCGSYATGWQWTGSFMKGKMTLASAMAISGAALNPSAGCGGDGVTRSSAISVLMGLLNFRLGYWVPNPKNWQKRWKSGLRNPNFLLPGLWEVLFRDRLKEDASFLQLSDGGHFENLALFELVRRKLRLIIVCDAGSDPKYAFSDLANAMEKIRTDFGALIMIDNEKLKALIPKKEKDSDEPQCAEQGHLVATIKYADNSEGTLIYMTTTFFKGVSADLYGYKKAHPAFPDESTADQFFDEKQFEAYRELGFQTAWKMMDNVKQDTETVNRIWPGGVPRQ